jgi:hypothetical protein
MNLGTIKDLFLYRSVFDTSDHQSRRKYFELLDSGQLPQGKITIPYGTLSMIRIDNIKETPDFFYLNNRQIAIDYLEEYGVTYRRDGQVLPLQAFPLQ